MNFCNPIFKGGKLWFVFPVSAVASFFIFLLIFFFFFFLIFKFYFFFFAVVNFMDLLKKFPFTKKDKCWQYSLFCYHCSTCTIVIILCYFYTLEGTCINLLILLNTLVLLIMIFLLYMDISRS
jgi:hypothetical protein